MTMTGMNEHFIYQDMPTFRVMYLKKNHDRESEKSIKEVSRRY